MEHKQDETLAPWEYGGETEINGQPFHIIQDAKPQRGARGKGIVAFAGSEDYARLIAAAPELLQALDNALARIAEADEHNPPDVGQMKTAIQKAKGE